MLFHDTNRHNKEYSDWHEEIFSPFSLNRKKKKVESFSSIEFVEHTSTGMVVVVVVPCLAHTHYEVAAPLSMIYMQKVEEICV